MARGEIGPLRLFGAATRIHPAQKCLIAISRKAPRDLRIIIMLGRGLRTWIARMSYCWGKILFRPDFKNTFWRAFRHTHSDMTTNGILFVMSRQRSGAHTRFTRRLRHSMRFTARIQWESLRFFVFARHLLRKKLLQSFFTLK